MDLLDIKCLIEVANTNSFSKAAAVLHMSQPSVSKKIRELESELKMKLFTRSTKGVKLTAQGQVFEQYARRCLQLISEGIEMAQNETTYLKIAAPASYSEYFFEKILPFLHVKEAKFDFFHYHSREILQMVLDDTLDLGFIVERFVQGGLESKIFHRDPIIFVVPIDHQLAKLESISIADLREQNIALFSWGKGFLELEQMLEDHSIKSNQLRRIAPVALAKHLIMNHNYVGFLPKITVNKELETEKVKWLHVENVPKWYCNFAVVYKKGKKNELITHITKLIDNMNW